MAHNHRGQPIADNYRPTPRLASRVEQHLNQKIEDAADRLQYDQPLLGYTMGGQPSYTAAGSGQHVLDRYRSSRDSVSSTPSAFGKEARQYDVNRDAENINEAITERHDEYYN